MQLAHIIAAILCSCRLTDLVTADRIFEPVRRRWPIYLWTCSRCVSVWAGIVTVVLYFYWPLLNWPLALSQAVILQAFLISRKVQEAPTGQRRIVVEVDAQENIHLKQCDFNAPSSLIILDRVAAAMRQQAARGVSSS